MVGFIEMAVAVAFLSFLVGMALAIRRGRRVAPGLDPLPDAALGGWGCDGGGADGSC